MDYTIGSLFDGSGGFPLAASLCDMTPLWASEIEPYPIAVTRSRFPNMLHLGSVTEVSGAFIPPVDVVTFGSPCQDLSVAGKRAGLKHEANGDEETTRSGLFMEAVRIIKEMREATNGQQPRFALWENVPGAFSSNKGEDFRIVLEELVKIAEPQAPALPSPGKDGWPYADVIVGDGWSVAWRTFDAQYWGVPQRRRRIHLVADFAGECAAEVLFEREGLRGYFAQGGEAREGTTGDAQGSTGGSCTAFHLQQDPISGDISPCVDRGQNILCYAPNGNHCGNYEEADVSATLQTRYHYGSGGDAAAVVYDYRGNGDGVHVPTLTGDHGNRVTDYTAVCVGNGQMCNITMQEVSNTLDCMHDQQAILMQGQHPRKYIVRRLTPLECCRLQGFPDWWGIPDRKDDFTEEELAFWLEVRNTHAAINGKAVKVYTKAQMLKWYNGLYTDSAEYKMWGNGIALPPALYVMQGINEVMMKEELL